MSWKGFGMAFLLLVLSGQQLFSQGYKINTEIIGQKDTVAYLGHHFATQRYVDDTASVVNGIAVFSGDETLEEGIYFYYSPSVYFEFLIGEQNFSISGEANDVVATAKITGSPLNIGFYRMQRYTSKKRHEAKNIQALLDSAATEDERAKLVESLKTIDEEVKTFQVKLQKEFPGSLLDRLIRVMQTPNVPPTPAGADSLVFKYQYYKAHFWDGIDIADPGILRSPMLHTKVTDYLDNVVIQQPDSVIIEVDKLIEASKKNLEAFRYLLITLTNKYEASPVMGFDKIFVHIVDRYYLTGQATWADDEVVRKLESRAASIRPNLIGNLAHDFTLQDTLGTDYRLYDIKADYTVLYFYDPDCGHCKKSTPILYSHYPELKEKNVEVLAICTTTNAKRWHEFIIDNDLNWINLADLPSKTYVKYYYDIRSTPTVYILDKDKKILLKKVATEDVPQIIDQLIAYEEKKD